MFVDSHTHLDHCKEDPSVLVAAARRADVGVIIQAGIDLERSRESILLAERYPEIFAVIGFHPQEAGFLDEQGKLGLEALAAHPRVVAVGETGFDFYHDRWPHDVQEDVFLYHLDLARRADLPLVVHTRDAAEVTLRLLAEKAQGLTVVLHCFSLPAHLTEVVERGYYVSFAGNVTYPKAVDLQEAARAVPSDLLLFETDAPWLAPAPLRGRPNHPALVVTTYDFVASLRGVTIDTLTAQVEANVLRAFPRVAAALRGRAAAAPRPAESLEAPR